MTVFIIVREDQNEHGYVDTSIVGIFRDRQTATDGALIEEIRARSAGLVVDDEESLDAGWQVALRIEEHLVDRT